MSGSGTGHCGPGPSGGEEEGWWCLDTRMKRKWFKVSTEFVLKNIANQIKHLKLTPAIELTETYN